MIFYNVFSGLLTGATKDAYVRNLGDRVFNSLHSYWYLRDCNDEKLLEGFSLTKGKIMIDSGAFTAYADASMKRGKSEAEASKGTVDIDQYIENYINWINKWDKYVTVFGQMDVIPVPGSSRADKEECCKKTWDNFLYMYSKLNNPQKLLYTFHCGEDFKWLKQALEFRDNQGRKLDYIAIGGLVGKTTKVRDDFLDRVFKIIKTSSNPDVKVHGFGVSSIKLWRKYPFESCDSFTPGTNANHGYSYKPKGGTYRAPDYKKIYKPKGRNKQEQEEIDRLEALKSEEQKQAESEFRTNEKVKLLISNIEYWTNLGNSIEKPKFNPNRGLFKNL